MDVDIEPEQVTDRDAVRLVVSAAFDRQPEVADLVDLIRASAQYEPEMAVVARHHGAVVGYVMLSRAELVDEDNTRHDVLTLSPLAVDPPVQRNGIGSALVREALRRAALTAAPLVTLEGSPRYYRQFGFRDCRSVSVVIDLPDWAPPDAGQVHLLPAYEQVIRGRLVYPPAFSTV